MEGRSPGNHTTFGSLLVPEKIMGQILLKTVTRQMKDKTTGNSQTRSTKGSLYVTNLVAISNEMTGEVDKERAVDVILL